MSNSLMKKSLRLMSRRTSDLPRLSASKLKKRKRPRKTRRILRKRRRTWIKRRANR